MFAAPGVLPLVRLGQLGLVVGLGVLVGTTLVRTLVIPAVFTLIGDQIWWPRQIRQAQSANTERAVSHTY
ncbi:MMPL family transporter [Micromonospora sp. NPDC048909]|uniref:MMPL family transporter n=1 Tax=Micromonospora sp. NPDC048909 TaxID=3155643 RepID=UPI0033FF28E2